MKLFLILLFFPCIISAQFNPAFVTKSNISFPRVENSSDGMFGFEEGDKFGYMDVTGKVVIPATYSYESTGYKTIPLFRAGYAVLKKDGKYGIVDKKGNTVIPFEHETLSHFLTSKNYAAIGKTLSGKIMYGLISMQNKVTIPMEYESLTLDSNLVVVRKNGKYGLMDVTGRVLLPNEYTDLASYSKDRALRAEKDGKYGFIDLAGNWLFEKSKSVYQLYGCSNGMISCKVNNKYGYLDLKGEEVIVTKYDLADPFYSELARVGKKSPTSSSVTLYGYVDKKGNEVVPLKFESLGEMKNGLAWAKDPETNRYGYLDKTGKWALKPTYINIATSFDDYGGAWVKFTDDKYHYINKAGKDFGVLDSTGKWFRDFYSLGYGLVENSDNAYALIDKTGKVIKKLDDCDGIYLFGDGSIAGYKCKSNSKYGFIDHTGKYLATCEYDGFSIFSGGYARVEKKVDGKTKYGHVDKTGKLIVPAVYDWALAFRDGWTVIKKDNNYFFMDKDGNLKDPPRKYDELGEFKSGYAVGKVKGEGTAQHTFYYINTQLKEEFTVNAWQAFAFWDDVAIVSRDNKTYEMMNKKGELYKILLNIETLSFCTENMLAVREKGKWGYVNDKGDMIVQPKYDTCTAFKYGYGRVKKGTKWGIVDRSGTELFEPKYDNIMPGENGLFIYYDKAWGLMDRTGKVLISPSLNTLIPFEKDRALARMGKTYAIIKSPLAK